MFHMTASTSAADQNGYFSGRLEFPDGGVEYFRSSLDYWSLEQYTQSWRSQLIAVSGGQPVGVLLTNVQDPEDANFFSGWTVYNLRDGFLYLQEGLFFTEDLPVGWTLNDPSTLAYERETVTETGERISEWRIRSADLDASRSISVTDEQW